MSAVGYNCPGCKLWVNPGATHTCTSGYTCPGCGQWVAPGFFHNCLGSQPLQNLAANPAELRMAGALEAISAHLFALVPLVGRFVKALEEEDAPAPVPPADA